VDPFETSTVEILTATVVSLVAELRTGALLGLSGKSARIIETEGSLVTPSEANAVKTFTLNKNR